MDHYDDERIVNVGWGTDVTIAESAELVARTVGFSGDLVFYPSMPDGTPRKLLDTQRLTSLGWRPKIGLGEGIYSTYQWFLENVDVLRT